MDTPIANAQSNTADSAQCEDTHPLLSVEITLSRFADDEELLSEVAAVFVRTVPKLVTSVTDAVSAGDLERAFHQAHSLKGAVAAFEAPKVLQAVLEVEGYARKGDAAATASAWPAALPLVERLLTELALVAPAGNAAAAAEERGR
jgi:HPt (histidine-containing phosphotransfer) domain-containing protein